MCHRLRYITFWAKLRSDHTHTHKQLYCVYLTYCHHSARHIETYYFCFYIRTDDVLINLDQIFELFTLELYGSVYSNSTFYVSCVDCVVLCDTFYLYNVLTREAIKFRVYLFLNNDTYSVTFSFVITRQSFPLLD